MIKKNIRVFIRKLLRVRKYENINTAIDRYVINFLKVFNKKTFTREDLSRAIRECGIEKGDTIMVHASWRNFYNFLGLPEDVIVIIREIIGDEGTILMPSYGSNRLYFDVDNTPSSAGVISEIFRKEENIYRSACTHFSVAAQGPLAEQLTKDHLKSEYGFDNYSPYYKFSQLDNSKVLFMGLGPKPTKISLFHCAGYILKKTDPYLNDLLSYKYDSKLVISGQEYTKKMVIRKPGHSNNNKVFRRILSSIKNKKQTKVQNIDLVTIDAKEGLKRAIEFAENGIYCYKN